MSTGRKVMAIAGMLLAAAMAAPAAAQTKSDYPNRPVMLIVPYGPGGVADVGMRILGEQLSSRLKQQFVIENRPGAGGIVAAQAGAAAAPDGYTLLMTGNNNAIAVALFKSLPYNILTDFDSVSTAAFFDLLIVTPRRIAVAIGAGRDPGGAGKSRQAQHRHDHRGEHAEPRGRAVHQHGRHRGDDRPVPHLA